MLTEPPSILGQQERFQAACQVTDLIANPHVIGNHVWYVTTIVKGGRANIDGPYFTEDEACISA
jgi:hypothetical protein